MRAERGALMVAHLDPLGHARLILKAAAASAQRGDHVPDTIFALHHAAQVFRVNARWDDHVSALAVLSDVLIQRGMLMAACEVAAMGLGCEARADGRLACGTRLLWAGFWLDGRVEQQPALTTITTLAHGGGEGASLDAARVLALFGTCWRQTDPMALRLAAQAAVAQWPVSRPDPQADVWRRSADLLRDALRAVSESEEPPLAQDDREADSSWLRGLRALLQGWTHLQAGRLERAGDTLHEARQQALATGQLLLAWCGADLLAQVRQRQGRLDLAFACHRSAVQERADQLTRDWSPGGWRPAVIGEAGAGDAPVAWMVSEPPYLKKGVQYIETHVGERLDTNQLARACGVSRRTLELACRRYRDTTPRALIMDVKMRHAMSLLRSGTVSASEARYCVGYVSHDAFSRDFRKVFGCEPAAAACAQGLAA